MLTFDEVNILGNLLNTTWGQASTERGHFPRGTASPQSLKGQLITHAGPSFNINYDVNKHDRSNADPQTEEVLMNLTYTDLVTFRSDQEAQASAKLFNEIAQKVCAAKVADIKSEFKGLAGRSLKIKLKQQHDSVESIYTPTPDTSHIAYRRQSVYRGYYRFTAIYTIE